MGRGCKRVDQPCRAPRTDTPKRTPPNGHLPRPADSAVRVDSLQTMHVKRFEKDERGIDKLIADNLRARGYKVSTGNAIGAALCRASRVCPAERSGHLCARAH